MMLSSPHHALISSRSKRRKLAIDPAPCLDIVPVKRKPAINSTTYRKVVLIKMKKAGKPPHAHVDRKCIVMTHNVAHTSDEVK